MFNSQVYSNFTWDHLLSHTWKKTKWIRPWIGNI